MKRKLALCLTALIVLFATHAPAEDTKLRFSIGEWPPYTGEKVVNFGLATEIVTAACTAVGLQAEYEFFPWRRAEKNVEVGSHFGTFPYKETAERVSTYDFSEVLFSSSFAIVTAKNNKNTRDFKYSVPEDLENHSVGIVTGTDAIRLPLEKIGIKVEEVAGVEQNLKKLEAGRIDFYIDDKAVIYQALKNGYTAEQMAGFQFAENGFGETNDFKIMISKKYPDSKAITAKLNEGLGKIKQSGEHQKILAKYGL